MDNVDTNTLSFFILQEKTLILPKGSLKLISSTYSSLWLTTYLLSLVDVFFNRHFYGYNLCFSSHRLVPLIFEGDFTQGLLKKNEKKLTRSVDFSFRYIDDVISLNTSRFGDFVGRIYPIELEIKDTTDTDRSAPYLDLHLEMYSEGRLRTKLYDKKRLFQFSYCKLSIYMWQHSSSTCTWRIYLSVDTTFKSLWFLSGFPW
jgi:hypothetical protein